MKKDHAILDFVKAPIAVKIETGRSVETKMRPNPIFVNPDVPFDDLKACTNLLETRNVAALNGGKEATALLHQTEEDWINKMRITARYVDRIANGDGAIILGAGFNLAKQPAPASRPEFSVEQGEKSGSVYLQRKRVTGARSYIWQQSTDGEVWTTAQTTAQASVEITGLTPLTKYWFRVAAVTITGTTDFNDPIMQVVI
jgi:hypothetical protein